MRTLYTAQAHVTGGRQHGHGRTTDGALDVQLRAPRELGGEGGGANPEQLFAIGYAACFEAAMTIAAQRLKIPVERVDDVAIDAQVMLIPSGERALKLGVAMAIELPSIDDPRQAAELVRVTHGICPYSNATRGNVDVALRVNGVALQDAREAA
jgi:lipoyl-dependent peroxiredoxin